MKKKFIILAISISISGSVPATFACTTGLAGPNVTKNSHVLLWKNRDSGFRNNAVVFFNDNSVHYLGLINAGDTSQVWAGVNNFGFAIMNAESRDLARPGENTGYDDEGIWMKAALRQCRTVDDFEEMLRRTNSSGRKVTSNFGVIDALGNAAFFETGNHEYFRFDADPPGYLVRANFAYNARSAEGYGRARYNRAKALIADAIQKGQLDHRYLITTVSRDMTLPDSLLDTYQPHLRETRNTINRHRTVSAAIFDATADNSPETTTFWCTLGEPAVAIAVPLWVRAERIPDALNGRDSALLNSVFRDIKSAIYADETRIDLGKYQSLRRILDRAQNRIFRTTARQLRRWEKIQPKPAEVAEFQDRMVSIALKAARKALATLRH